MHLQVLDKMFYIFMSFKCVHRGPVTGEKEKKRRRKRKKRKRERKRRNRKKKREG